MDISIPYYQDNSRISNSAIGWFINYGPAYFHARLSGDIEEEPTSAMSKGTMIHMYLLQPEEFHKTYKVFTGTRPASGRQAVFCEALINTVEIEPDRALINAYREAYSTTNQSDDKVLSKAKELANTLSEWIEYRRNPEYETISVYDAKMLQTIKANCDNHKLASKLLSPKNGETYHEFHINWEFRGLPCKSLLDSAHFDFENKICTLVDLKTTTKICHFEESVDQYDYLRQLEFYKMALEWYLKNERNEDPDTWRIKTYIIAIDTTNFNEIRVFNMSVMDIYLEQHKLLRSLENIKWHFENDKWEHHRAYYEGDGAETLHTYQM